MSVYKKLTGITISSLSIMFLCFLSIVLFPVSLTLWLITYPIDRNRKYLHLYTSACLSLWVWLMPLWRVRVDGRDKIKKNSTYVIVANHESQLDIPVTALLFRQFKWISKAEVLKVPFLGWQLAMNGYITIKRGYVNSIAAMMDDCEKALIAGSSILLFPEGGRSVSGPDKFRPGAFILAKNQGVPVIPVVIHGTRDALPKTGLFSYGVHRIVIKVLDEIPSETFDGMTAEQSATLVRDEIAKHYQIIEERKKLGYY